MTEDLVNTIAETRGPSLRACHICTKYAPDDQYYLVKAGVPIIARGPFIEFVAPSGAIVQIVYNAIETVSYPIYTEVPL
jgi:hypothetical protein